MSINLSWNKVRGCHCPQWSGRNTTGSAASTLWPLAVKWCSHLSWLSKAMHCSVPAEISFQSGNFRYFSFWSQKQNPTSGLYLMAPWDTHAHVILSYIITSCLHILSMCFSIQDYSPFSFKICCACSWVSQGGCFQVVCEWHCWLWLNTRPQAWDQDKEYAGHSRQIWAQCGPQHHSVFWSFCWRRPVTGSASKHPGQIVAWWTGVI